MEREPKPRITWLEDEEGEHFRIKTEHGTFDIRPENTVICTFGDQYRKYDHLYRITEDNGDSYYGFRLHRERLEIKGFDFEQICAEMINREFDVVYEDVPNQEEIDAYNECKTEPTKRADTFEQIVKLAMINFDSAWKWYEGEWN